MKANNCCHLINRCCKLRKIWVTSRSIENTHSHSSQNCTLPSLWISRILASVTVAEAEDAVNTHTHGCELIHRIRGAYRTHGGYMSKIAHCPKYIWYARRFGIWLCLQLISSHYMTQLLELCMLMILIKEGWDRTLDFLSSRLVSEYICNKSCGVMATWQVELSKIPKCRLHEARPASDTGQYHTK